MKTSEYAQVSSVLRIVEYVALTIFLIGFSYAMWSCCKTCPAPEIAPTVIEQPCKLPPVPRLPVAKSIAPDTGNCPRGMFCYDVENAMAIVDRDGRLRQWVAEVVARCGEKPSSRPTEARDAGSSRQ